MAGRIPSVTTSWLALFYRRQRRARRVAFLAAHEDNLRLWRRAFQPTWLKNALRAQGKPFDPTTPSRVLIAELLSERKTKSF